jgi:hypothetical protein
MPAPANAPGCSLPGVYLAADVVERVVSSVFASINGRSFRPLGVSTTSISRSVASPARRWLLAHKPTGDFTGAALALTTDVAVLRIAVGGIG